MFPHSPIYQYVSYAAIGQNSENYTHTEDHYKDMKCRMHTANCEFESNCIQEKERWPHWYKPKLRHSSGLDTHMWTSWALPVPRGHCSGCWLHSHMHKTCTWVCSSAFQCCRHMENCIYNGQSTGNRCVLQEKCYRCNLLHWSTGWLKMMGLVLRCNNFYEKRDRYQLKIFTHTLKDSDVRIIHIPANI